MDEFRVSLNDRKLDLLGIHEPDTFEFLNFSDFVADSSLTHGTINIDIMLSQKVTIQNRIMYDFAMMFGDVGGLYDFINLSLAALVGFFSKNFLVASLIQKLFWSNSSKSTADH